MYYHLLISPSLQIEIEAYAIHLDMRAQQDTVCIYASKDCKTVNHVYQQNRVEG